jgi:uncharacterized protein (DUF849 family)
MMLKACLNGPRRPADHPALPIAPAEVARDAVASVAAGVQAVHLHVKDDGGADTLDGKALAAVLGAVRTAVPGTPIGVTTGAWTIPDPEERVAAIRSWTVLPDFASVNWHEEGAEDVAAALLDLKVGVEAGLWHAAAIQAWRISPNSDRCCRILLELQDDIDSGTVEKEADRLLSLIGPDRGIPILLHGEETTCWPALRHAQRLGLATRIGLEDTLTMPDGSPASDNAALVRAAIQR